MTIKKEGRNRSRIITTLITAVLFSVLLSPGAPAADLGVRLFTGYDSFIDRFTIVEEDTFDIVNDFYLGFGGEFLLKGRKGRLNLRNNFKYGKQAVDESFEMLLALRPSKKSGIDVRNSFNLKHFQPGSDYAFSNDYMQLNSSVKLKRSIGSNYLIALNGRIEALRYEERTDFDYNYNYVDAGLHIERDFQTTGLLHLAAFAGRREAPDTTELSFDRFLGIAESSIPLDLITLRFTTSADRKDYSSTVRSSYWYVISNLEATLNEMKKTSYSLIIDSELTSYDTESEIYINTHFVRLGLKYKHEIGNLSYLYIEPRVARMYCNSSAEERYVEGSMVLGLDVFDGGWFWFTAVYEPGYRDYTLKENSIYSDFTINRLSLIGSVHLPEHFSLDIFVTHEPEKHSRREDDFSVSLISLELKKTF